MARKPAAKKAAPKKTTPRKKPTPKQQRASLAKRVDRLLPAKGTKGGETVVPDRLLREIVRKNK